jgi:hypothetical protein
MGAVGERFAGTASGVNNAVARVAGLLAVAGLGVVFLAVFEAGLADPLDGLGLPPELRRELTEEAGSAALAGSLPAGDWGGRAAELRAAVQAAYLGAFRAVMLIAAALALAAGACGWAMIGGPDGRRSGRSGAS